MGWLAKIGIQAALEWALGKILALINLVRSRKQSHDENAAKAAKESKKAKEIKPESTDKEVDEAIDDELGSF